jgi:cytochrome c oxidase subunit 4
MRTSTLIIVYVLLVILLGLTLWLGFLPAQGTWNPIAGLLVAATKAILIALIFMHVHDQSGLVKIFAVAGVFWLLLLFLLTATDYLTITWL